MSYKIEIQPAGVYFQSEDNILDDALVQSVPLEHSCKTGDCGACSADIISGEIENEHGEIVNSGVVLTCQSKAKSDAILKAHYYPELVGQKLQTIPCKVAGFELVTNDIMVVKFRFPPTAKFDYLPGQYIDLSFKGIKRSYSIANAKQVSDGLELHIRNVPNGQMSAVIFGDLKQNHLMRFEGPKGTFFVKNNDKPLVLLATGTGIAPIKAIVEELVSNQDEREIHIYWGMQYASELYCKELIELAEQHQHIHFNSVLSKELNEQSRQGYVQDTVCQDFDSLANYEVYACGSLQMIRDAKAALLNKKLPSNAFYSDAFTPAK
ncbi:MAG: 2Fe-2S iron-sulfur cluster binding domain-containing protein [Saccharospirillaceae bacterium]|nr:2Fe-2S iron-sulfur cluster binding domain-containing protein [Saccharospirillaceae bacterium]